MKVPFSEISFSQYELKDSLRLGLQASVSSAAFFLIMQTFGLPEKFVGVLSAVLVLEPSVGSTLVNAFKRFKATVIGCLVGAACLVATPSGWGTALALAVSMFAMYALVGLRPEWKYGVVAAVALAIGSDQNLWQTAWDRSLSIGIGVIIGAVVSVIVWPDKSSERVNRHLRWALELLADYLKFGLKQTHLQSEQDDFREKVRDFKNRYSSQISTARGCVEAIRLTDSSELNRKIHQVDRLYHAISILERISEEADQIDKSEDDDFLEPVSSIKDLAADILEALVNEEVSPEQRDQRKKLSETVDEVRSVVSEDDERSAAHHTQRQALVFALDEIEDSLKGLLEEFAPDEGESKDS